MVGLNNHVKWLGIFCWAIFICSSLIVAAMINLGRKIYQEKMKIVGQ